MAPRATSKSKNHKSKGEKKKKEDKLLPTVLDVLVYLPSGDEIILKGISTDRILDVRKLLAVNVETCHLTRFSLSHQVRGDRLNDSQEVMHLKPCVLTVVEEAYTEESAMDHVRRLLDLVSSITCFGPSGKSSVPDKETDGKADGTTGRTESGENSINLKDIKDITKLCPPSELGKFYEFFSFAHLKSPVQGIKISRQAGSKTDFFSIEVKVTNGKILSVTACSTGFYHTGKQQVKCHALVDLLRHLSKSFNDNYEELLKAFCARNKFANIPYGLRANTWVVPPIAAESPSTFPALPAEDETCGGNGGGRGRNPEGLNVPWSQHFSFIAKMACETSEEREVRDHKAFVLHNYFVDVATTHAVAVIRELDSSSSFQTEHVETRGTLKFSVTRDATDPGRKVVWKIESSSTTEFQREISERNVLKGITADESTVVHDTCTLGIVLVRHQGYKVVVEAVPTERTQDILEIMDPPEGGANALNANSLRILLHKKSHRLDTSGEEEKRAKDLLSETIDKAISSVSTQGPVNPSQYFRWELGACWVQHLGEITKANSSEKSDKSGQKPSKDEEPVSEDVSPLKGLLPKSSLERLKGTKSGLHLKSVAELMNAAEQYYNNVALPKLVSDFSALELSPVEGRTLTDFMHIRGLRISSLGQLADLCSKLPHIRSLCIHEMIIRAFKHLLRAVVASVKETSELASTIATALNAIFASLPAEGKEEPVEKHVWKWLESFVAARFRWKLAYDSRLNLRKYALLRGICYKVGIEMAPRSYNFNSTTIFSKADVISLVPVYKHAICSSADGRTLLESSKAALDKGKLEEAVSFGSKALTKLIAVCGPYHRMTAGAYSLLAVVLYHTGDFNQAMIYQQKALDINERELGLDHPDTMKSYGDLAVFYYRLQHTELALRYVNRALYLLHLICGPSHPNTAATYINVAMMEEALGNAHVALRYLHEALKCNERLLGKDHIQTAASYHAIAIALSLMEAYTLSVHHEQTTYQILQAKLGPDDIRTQDAAAWLDYFDSKAVEQQEATRTGAPKPDPSVASKGHLSVSDLLDYINKEVSTSSEKDKKPKRLKILTVEDIADSPKQEAGNSSSIQSQEESPIIKEEVSGQVREPPSNAEDRIAKISSSTEVSNAAVISSEEVNEDEGWFEATSRKKTLQRKKFSSSDVSGTSRMGFKGTRPDTPSESGSGTQEKLDVPSDSGTQEKLEVSSGVAEQGQVPSVTTQGNRSYKDVALMMIRPLQQLQQAAVKVAGTKTETKTTGQAEEEDLMSCEGSSSCSSSAAATTPAKTSIPKPAPRPDSQQTTIEVAMTPIRKQVHLPSKTQDCQPSVVTPPPLATPASLFNAPGSPSHHPPPTTPGAKKLMNPFAIEFVPGRKWHPFLPSETNSLQTGGSGSKDQDEKRESQGGVSDGDGDTTESLEQGSPAKPQAEETVKNSELGMAKTERLQEENLLQEEVAAAAQVSVTQEEQDESFEGEVAITTPSISLEQEDTGSNKEGIHSDSDERLLVAAGDRDQSGFAAAMASKRWCSSSNLTRSRSRGARWQRRSDGAITRVYRLQEGSSSANPQLKTTSTFTNVPEPHTLQSPASSTLMRRSVRVS